mmetsp:Transcript_3078/g.4151  ORF Transcript_3078/g.4151 Transcript_3078/m.4151 type:complete len:373 (-) Transcript_3078:39-1157(-)
MKFLVSAILLLVRVQTAVAWSSGLSIKRAAYGSSAFRLYNVPPPAESDTADFKVFASKQPPPASFFELQQDCVRSARLARKDGHKLLEIEFPPLPAAVLEMDDVSAYDVAQANLKLAIDFCKGMLIADQDGNAPKKIAILFPDEPELDFSVEKAGSANPYPGITLGSIRTVDPDDDRFIKPENFLLNLFGNGSGGKVKALPDVDMYVCLTASAQELPDIEELHELDPEKTIVMYNMKLDVLRGDLGAPAFPGQDFQDRFLSRVKPIYYLRTRQYSRSTAQRPFLVNFQGCLFRAYPGQFQTLLDTGNGRYRRLLGTDVRPALGLFKQQLIDSLKIQGTLKDEGKTLNFLRTGYKTTTWWEEDREDASDAWRT